MCIMEIHARQETSTMVQACLHNVATVRGDLDMLGDVLARRQSTTPAELEEYRTACATVAAAVDSLHHFYGVAIADRAEPVAEHVHDDPAVFGMSWVGAERAAERMVAADFTRARKDETR